MNKIGARWAILSPLLDELLEDGAAAGAKLAEIRRENPTLADELVEVLRQQTDIDRSNFLEDPPPTANITGVRPSCAVGNYTLLRPLGQGGMGVVWLAKRSDGRFQGQAALKFLNRALAGPVGLDRFQREGSALARLSHPNIARLLDSGVNAAGHPYLVLEYVVGEPIDRWCESRQLDTRQRVELMLEVLAAVEHAHGKLILHRDLKPANILVTTEGQVKLLDFGIAKLLDSDSMQQQAQLTELHARVFTLDYASPEQVTGDEVTMASDVYSLGVLLYGLLTGCHPTAGESRTPIARMRAIVETEPRRPSDTLEMVRPSHRRTLRADLDCVVLKALKVDVDQRYPTARALADDLRRYLGNEPVTARPDSTWYRIRKLVRRNRVVVAAVVLALLALNAGLLIAISQLQVARAERERSDLVKHFIVSLFRSADPFQVGQTPRTTADLLQKARARLEVELREQPQVNLELLAVIGESQLGLGHADASQSTLEAVLTRALQLGPEFNEQVAAANAALAQLHLIGGKYQLSLKYSTAAIEVARDFRGRQAKTLVDALVIQAYAYSSTADPRFATSAREAVAIGRRHLGEADPHVIAAQVKQADLLLRRGFFKEGAEVARRGYELTRAVQGSAAMLAGADGIYGVALAETGRLDEGLVLLRRSVRHARESLGEGSNQTAVFLSYLATYLERAGDLRGAIELTRQLISTVELPDGRHHLGVMLARFLMHAGRFEEAAGLFERSIAGLRSIDPSSGFIAVALAQWGHALVRAGRLEDAIAVLQSDTVSRRGVAARHAGLCLATLLQKQLDAAEGHCNRATAVLGQAENDVRLHAQVLAVKGRLELAQGKLTAAESTLLQAEQLYRRDFRAVMPPRVEVLVARGQVALARGEPAQALVLLTEAADFWQRFDPGHALAQEALELQRRAQRAAGRHIKR